MTKAAWTVSPRLTPWRGDQRRNSTPYYIGAGMSMTDYDYAVYVKRVLESRGISCYVHLVDSPH